MYVYKILEQSHYTAQLQCAQILPSPRNTFIVPAKFLQYQQRAKKDVVVSIPGPLKAAHGAFRQGLAEVASPSGRPDQQDETGRIKKARNCAGPVQHRRG